MSCCLCCRKRPSQRNLSDGLLFGLGNPLLDVTAVVDDEFLAKYNLQPDDATLLNGGDGRIKMIYDLVDKYKVEYVAGGATQNTLRTVQWILRQPNVTTFVGCVGDDIFGSRLQELAAVDNVNTCFQTFATHPTGTCVALITGRNRSLVAYPGASKELTKDFLDAHFDLVEKAAFYYIEGYFIGAHPGLMKIVAKHASTNNKIFAINLSAVYIVKEYTEQLLGMLPYADILFGNKTEAKAFAEVNELGTEDIPEIAKLIFAYRKQNTSRPRIVVITQSEGPVIVVCKSDNQANKDETVVQEFPTTEISQEKIKDTNGAGDAFVGGFLAQYIQGKDIQECCKCGAWAAAEVIQQTGCTFPRKVYPG